MFIINIFWLLINKYLNTEYLKATIKQVNVLEQ